MKPNNKDAAPKLRQELIEERDYYFENGLMVLTAHFLRERGFCCGNKCRHCPYTKIIEAHSKQVTG